MCQIRILTMVSVVMLCATAFGQISSNKADKDKPDVPDLSHYDAKTLRELCTILYERIHDLEKKVKKLELELTLKGGPSKSGNAASGAVGGTSGSEMIDSSWIVTVTAITDSSDEIAKLGKQIESEQNKLDGQPVQYGSHILRRSQDGIDARLAEAQRIFAHKKGEEVRYWDSDGKSRFRKKYDYNDLKPYQRRVTLLKSEKRRVESTIRRLKREIDQLKRRRVVVGKTDDDLDVKIVARGTADVAVADGLQIGKTYRITGRGQFTGNSGRIDIRGAVPLNDESGPTDAFPSVQGPEKE